MIRRLLLATVLGTLALAQAAGAASYVVDPAHSEVSFRIRHFVSKVRGHFRDFSATIVKDDENPAAASVELTIQAASIDTAHEQRDGHLRSGDFFDVENHPLITFQSTIIAPTGDNSYDVTGELTIRGETKTVTLPVTFTGEVPDGRGGFRAGFAAETTLDRKDFGITWNRVLDHGTMLGDEVEIEISFETKRQ